MEHSHEKELEELLEEGRETQFVLKDGHQIYGTLEWFDEEFIQITAEVEGRKREVTIAQDAILYYYRFFQADRAVPGKMDQI